MGVKTIAVDCGKDETKICMAGEDGKLIHERFKTRMEKTTPFEDSSMHPDNVHTVTFEGKTYLVGAKNDCESHSNSKEELIHKVLTLTAIGMNVDNDDVINIAIGCPISEYRNEAKRKSYLDYILPPEGNRVEIFIDGKKKYFTIGKRKVFSECIGALYVLPDKFRENLTGIIDIGGLNVNGSFFSNGKIEEEHCFTIKYGKNTVINTLKQQFQETFDGEYSRAHTEIFLDNGKVPNHEDESAKIIEKALYDQLNFIKETCLDNGWNLDICNLVFIGGTTNLLKNRIQEVFGDKVVTAKEAGFANVDGYLKLLSLYLDMKKDR